MNEKRKKRLVELGTETLADALLEMASRNDTADDLVERMIATPGENVKRFKAKLASLRRSRRFIRWGESSAFARELQTLLLDLKAGVSDPKLGSELVAAFYETDKGTLGNCDDSSGHVGDIYRFDAQELFVGYARCCPDKKWLANLVFKLNRDDDYGVRDALINCAADYLPEPDIRTLIDRLQGAAKKEDDEYQRRHWLHLIESLARQIKDAALFEKTRIASWGKLSTAACVDIARVYQESGNARTALSWLEKISAAETFQAYERDRLLLNILGQLGEKQKEQDVAWRIFRRHRSKDSLEDLLSVIGQEMRDSVTTGETESILVNESLSLSDAAFLTEMGCIEEVERYLLERAEQLNGDLYGSLLPLAKAMESDARNLAATVIYRALLDSILRRGQTKTYPHGVRYLKKLDRLAKSVTDWRGQVNHDSYLQQVRQSHGRKYSFWSRYGK
jgi:hypothetical protein